MLDKVALRQVFSEYFGFPCQSSFHKIHHHHNHPGQVQQAIQWSTCRVHPVWTPPPTMRIKKKAHQLKTRKTIRNEGGNCHSDERYRGLTHLCGRVRNSVFIRNQLSLNIHAIICTDMHSKIAHYPSRHFNRNVFFCMATLQTHVSILSRVTVTKTRVCTGNRIY
jgi:hypothetical protein